MENELNMPGYGFLYSFFHKQSQNNVCGFQRIMSSYAAESLTSSFQMKNRCSLARSP